MKIIDDKWSCSKLGTQRNGKKGNNYARQETITRTRQTVTNKEQTLVKRGFEGIIQQMFDICGIFPLGKRVKCPHIAMEEGDGKYSCKGKLKTDIKERQG